MAARRSYATAFLAAVVTAWIAAAAAAGPVASFGNWLIFYTPQNNTYFLRGLGSDPISYFDVQCNSEKGSALLMIPVWTQGYKPLPSTQVSMLVWSDHSEAKEMSMVVANGLVAIGLNSLERPDSAPPRFISALMAAEKYVAFSYNGQTFEFDAKYLPVARLKFGELCLSLQGR